VSTPELQPIYLLADSQLLFWKSRGGPFLPAIFKGAGITEPRIAYLGASNGDSSEAYSIFAAAVEGLKGARTHHVRASYSDADRKFLESASVLVLAGGDVEAGWNAFTQAGVSEQIKARYRDGAVVIGVSAGAVQCGSHAAVWSETGEGRLIEMLGLVPFIVDVHAEKEHWQKLSGTIRLMEGAASGVGIPSGGGLAVHPDGTLEPLRRAAEQFEFVEGKFRHAMLVQEPD
jgi:cyanophycinase-like exopeptidase